MAAESHSPPEQPLSSTQISTLKYIEMLWGLLRDSKNRIKLHLFSSQKIFLILFLNLKQFPRADWKRAEWYTVSCDDIPCNVRIIVSHYCTISLFWYMENAQSSVSRLPHSSCEGNLFITSWKFQLRSPVCHFLKGIQNQWGKTMLFLKISGIKQSLQILMHREKISCYCTAIYLLVASRLFISFIANKPAVSVNQVQILNETEQVAFFYIP